MCEFREENQKLTSELQKFLAVESLSKEEPGDAAADKSEQLDWSCTISAAQ